MSTQNDCCPSTCHAERERSIWSHQPGGVAHADASLSLRMTRLWCVLIACYGPFAMGRVTVVVYVPGSVPGGIVTLTIIESPNCPRPKRLAASKNFTGGGGGLPAGSSNG